MVEVSKLLDQRRRAVDDYAVKVEAVRFHPTIRNVDAMHRAAERAAVLRKATSLMIRTVSVLPLKRDIRKPETGG